MRSPALPTTNDELTRARAKCFAYTPATGFESNPLRAHRNLPCPCGSKLKAKRCHGRSDFLPKEEVAKVKAYLRKLSAAGFIVARPSEIA